MEDLWLKLNICSQPGGKRKHTQRHCANRLRHTLDWMPVCLFVFVIYFFFNHPLHQLDYVHAAQFWSCNSIDPLLRFYYCIKVVPGCIIITEKTTLLTLVMIDGTIFLLQLCFTIFYLLLFIIARNVSDRGKFFLLILYDHETFCMSFILKFHSLKYLLSWEKRVKREWLSIYLLFSMMKLVSVDLLCFNLF